MKNLLIIKEVFMKFIISMVFLLSMFGCNESEAVAPSYSSYVFMPSEFTPIGFELSDLKPVSLDLVNFHWSLYYNGQIDFLNENSWVFTSHTNALCFNVVVSHCRKVDASIVEGKKKVGRITRVTFDLNVVELDLDDSPYWVILYQDWVKIDPTDNNGNHPITTVKLKVFNGNLNVCHYRNDWQWGYDHGTNRDGVNIDINHDLHQENDKGGCAAINVGIPHKIEIWNYDDGFFQLYVDEDLISHYAYQTKSPTEDHIMQWGQYWSKGYNKENDPLKRIVIRMDDFKVSAYLP